MRGWKQEDVFLVVQESRDCFDFISDVEVRGSRAIGTVNKQLD